MCHYVAYNKEHDVYLSLSGGQWKVTRDKSKATPGSSEKLTNIIRNNKTIKATSGEWKMLPYEIPCIDLSGVVPKVRYTAPSTGELKTPDEILRVLKEFDSVFNKKNYDYLRTAHSDVEKKLVDLYHYIEFSHFDAAQGYKAYKMLHDLLIRRREIKQQVAIFQVIMKDEGLDINSDDFQNLLRETHTVHYEPRVLRELFS